MRRGIGDRADRLRAVRVDGLALRLDGLQRLTLKAHLSARVPGLFAINIERDTLARDRPLQIHRTVQRIGEFEIHARGLRDGGIVREIDVPHDKRVIVPLIHLKLRPNHSIVQRRGHLTDAAAEAVHHLRPEVRAGQLIAVLRCEGCDRLQHRKFLPGINHRSIDEAAGVGDIGAPRLS